MHGKAKQIFKSNFLKKFRIKSTHFWGVMVPNEIHTAPFPERTAMEMHKHRWAYANVHTLARIPICVYM